MALDIQGQIQTAISQWQADPASTLATYLVNGGVTALQLFKVLFTVNEAGAIIVGGVTSLTVTVAFAKAEFPLLSVTVNLTKFAPTFAQLKEVLSKVMDDIPTLSAEPLFT